MSKSTPLTLARLIRSKASPVVPRRAFATTLQQLPTPSPSLPYFPSLPYASSSKHTLDHPLFLQTPPADPISAALLFAADEDLIHVLLSNPAASTESHGGWTSTIDPGLAFLALRSRPMYSLFLQSLHPYAGNLFTRLRPSGVHQLLVSDLLLRHPDPRILRDLLEIDAGSGRNTDRVRSSLVISLYTHLRPSISRQSITLTRRATMHVSKSVLAKEEQDVSLLPLLFADLYRTTTFEPEGTWILFDLILHTLRQNTTEAAKMFRRLVTDEQVPRSLLGKSNPRHPKSREILILSAITRCCLEWKLFERAQGLADELYAAMLESEPSESGVDVILEVVRTAIAGKQVGQLTWAGEMILKFVKRKLAYVDGALIDAFLEAVPTPAGIFWFAALPTWATGGASPALLMELASCRSEAPAGVQSDLLRRIAHDMAYQPANTGSAQRPRFLHILALAGMVDEIKSLHTIWREKGSAASTPIDADTLVALIHTLGSDKSVTHQILTEFEATRFTYNSSPASIAASAKDRLALVECHLILRDKSLARRHLAALDPRVGVINEVMSQAVQVSSQKGDFLRLAEDMGFIIELVPQSR